MKPNFDTHAAYVSLINVGFDEKKATQLLETIKDSQDDLVTKSDLKMALEPLSWQIKGLFALNAGVIAAIVWFGNALLDKIK